MQLTMRVFLSLFAVATLLIPSLAQGYAVLTHEAVIDSVWDGSIKPLLIAKFPKATKEEIHEAHGYAYGGAIIQDFGYYPKGSKLFSDLTHYLRTGEFIQKMIADATTIDEYAFALGSLAHYASDEQGHSVAVNRAVAMLYPKLKKKFGPVVTYEDDPSAHLKMEFAFDVVQVARGYYAPEAYHDFIGFQVAKPLLEKAFEETYCLKMTDLFLNLDLAIGTYRHVVSKTLPEATRVAWVMRKNDIAQHLGVNRTVARRKFLYNLSRSSYEKEWGRTYDKPGFKERFLAFLLRILPKIGPLRALQFKTPGPQAEDLFMKSFDLTVAQYKTLLSEVPKHSLQLRELNLDTGKTLLEVPYPKADETRQKWNEKLKGAACPVR